VGRRKFRRVSRVEKLRAIADSGSGLFDRQRLQFACERLIEGRPLSAVQHGVIGEVRRRVGLIRGHELDEAFLRHRLESVIETPLIADCGHRFLRDGLAAQRPGAMCGINLCRVRQRQQLFMDRVVQHCAELGCGPAERRAEIRSSHVADEQRVARQNRHGIAARRSVVDEQRNRFDRMPRRFENLDPDRSEIDRGAIPDGLEFIFGNRLPAEADGGAHAVAQFEMTRDEIGVKVRQEDVHDAEVVIRRKRQVLIDVTLRIDDGGRAAFFVGNDVRRMREAVQIKLFEDHVSIMRLVGSLRTES